MKANELRIGNYVYYNGNHKHISNVSSLQPKVYVEPYGAVCYSESIKVGLNNRFDIVYDVENIEPIPLTEEWLIKFGFKYNGWNYDLNQYVFHAQGKNEKGEFFNTEFGIKNNDITFNMSYTINSVHQLQNLYFTLTNQELNNE